MSALTKEFILATGHFVGEEHDGELVLFNGDNIMLFDNKVYWDAYLHSEYDGSIFYATRLFTEDHLRNLVLAIEKIDIYE